jgi:hypothetical protein
VRLPAEQKSRVDFNLFLEEGLKGERGGVGGGLGTGGRALPGFGLGLRLRVRLCCVKVFLVEVAGVGSLRKLVHL